MKVLLDTHTFIWWDSDPSKLSDRVRGLLQDPNVSVLLSVVSIWEMLIKLQLGKLSVTAPLATLVTQQQANGIQVLPVMLPHVLAVENLPPRCTRTRSTGCWRPRRTWREPCS
jgi:PIN domain nuclease of toxin-antitoxin system